MTYQPVIIIGAARSGTNILRDTLSSMDSWATWDCDEINLIWKHGNLSLPNDVMGPEHARPAVGDFIRSSFSKLHMASQSEVVLEKTCANSLRVPFIDAIFPNARYIYIVRDGRDVALSAAKRWTASIEPRYLMKKLRYVPLRDVPYHGVRFLKNRISQQLSSEKRQAFWGPNFPGMTDWMKDRPLVEVCARQWAECVAASDRAFAEMPTEKWIKVNYENLVKNPESVLNEILSWYSQGTPVEFPTQQAVGSIRAGSANGWRDRLDQFSPTSLEIMKEQLSGHGYEPTV